MYSKFGRGGGARGGVKRNPFPPPFQRPPSSSSSASKLSLSSRKPSSTPPPPPLPSESDESFSLVSGDPPAFASIIRLAPDLVDEIKRVESQGGAARIKFDSNPNNSSGNVIDVGGKEFRFTWSHEMGGLCDIYEECQSAVDGNGLFVESGCSWRKLNVQRVLDESTKKQVKKRSEEYEQKLKSRKAIVLDQCNPSMKRQMEALAAAKVSPWKFKHKNQKYIEPSQAGGHPKPLKPTSGFSATANAKVRRTNSPLPSPRNQPVSLASALVRGNAVECQNVLENSNTVRERAKENAFSSENDYPAQSSGRMPEAAICKDKQGAGMSDLWNLLVTLLKENANGMSLKALEKAVRDMTSNSACKIEPILKKIATYKSPGRYILKSGMDLESLKRSYCDSRCSPEDNNEKQVVPEDNHEVTAPDTGYAGKSPAEDLVDNVLKYDDESNMVENFDASQHFSDVFGDDEPPEHREGLAARSNQSDNDRDSDSGSESASRSRSRSLAGSGSASSSDSEGDDSSTNSKEASDVDIDIMSDEDKESRKLPGTEHGLSAAPVPWNIPGTMALPYGRNGDQDGYASEDVDIENDFLDDNEAQLATDAQNINITTDSLRAVYPDHDQNQPTNRTVNKREDETPHEHQISIKSGGNSKRGSKGKYDAHQVKRFKANADLSSISRNTGSRSLGSPLTHLSHGINEDNHVIRGVQMSNQFYKDDDANAHLGAQKGYSSFGSGKSATESMHSGQKPTARSYDIETTDKAIKNPPDLGVDLKSQETNSYSQLDFSKHEDKGYRDAQDEENSSDEKANEKVKRSPLVQKHPLRLEPHHRKNSEQEKKSRLGTSSRPSLKDTGKDDFESSPADKKRLQRELSDLELGELREPIPDEPKGTKRQQFETEASFKQSETKMDNSGSLNAELKGKPTSKLIMDSGNTTPNVRGAPNNSDSSSRRRSPEPYAEDSSYPCGTLQPQFQQSRNGHAEVGSLPNKAVDCSQLVQTETISNQGTNAEGYGETQKKMYISSQCEELRRENGSHKGKGNKSRKSNSYKDAKDRKRDGSSVQSRKEKRKRSESSLDENNSFSKFEKEEAELKESIKSFSQYKDYVQEYREKYESYCSIYKILDTYKIEFRKLGMDLGDAKGRDAERYHEILAQLRESYSRCGMRHKRMKKIFIVLHEELKHLKQMIKDFAAVYTRE